MDRGKGHAGCLAHVDGAFFRQVHVVKVDKLKLRLLLWPTKNNWKELLQMRHLLPVQQSSYVSFKCDKLHVSQYEGLYHTKQYCA